MVDRRPPVSTEEDEVTGLAGWLYTDLLLGLAVVFLGAITFTVARAPEVGVTDGAVGTTSTSTSTTSTSTTSTVPIPCQILPPPPYTERTKFRLSLSENSTAAEVASKLQAIRDANGISNDSGIGFVLVWSEGDDSSAAIQKAQVVWAKLTKALPEILKPSIPARYLWALSTAGQVDVDVFLQTGDCA